MATSTVKNNNMTELWSGSWNSGSITVPNSDKYNVFVIHSDDVAIICARLTDGSINGMSATPTRQDLIWTKAVKIQTNGTPWTLANSSVMGHQGNAIHGGTSAVAIDHIFGLI